MQLQRLDPLELVVVDVNLHQVLEHDTCQEAQVGSVVGLHLLVARHWMNETLDLVASQDEQTQTRLHRLKQLQIYVLEGVADQIERHKFGEVRKLMSGQLRESVVGYAERLQVEQTVEHGRFEFLELVVVQVELDEPVEMAQTRLGHSTELVVVQLESAQLLASLKHFRVANLKAQVDDHNFSQLAELDQSWHAERSNCYLLLLLFG